MSEVVSTFTPGETPMASTNKDEIKTNIRVPEEKYELLKDIKSETGEPINALIVEGVDLVLLKYESILKKAVKKAELKADKVEKTLAEIREEVESRK